MADGRPPCRAPRNAPRPDLELWGGLECSVVRLEHGFRDQIEETGHGIRPGDLERIAGLGIRTLRYPVLWERIAPERPDQSDWAWQDARMQRLSTLGINPVAGLLHHGSGPRYTNLLDPDFPRLLAGHARAVAERYPWIRDYTPVNEPLTTARFSALYGHWYPHHRNEASFLRALVNQCRGVLLSMRAVRKVNPQARLIQTEDLGKTFSTPRLRAQAQYENERRWLSLDLLCGQVDRAHPWRRRFHKAGISERAMDLFADGEGKPDIVGINHYLTSERFLDTRLGLYPGRFHGGNAFLRYADVEAVRVQRLHARTGPRERLREAWRRYRLPMAVTEAHHGCTREEQLRWLLQVWNDCEALRSAGVDVRAVTVWAVFGSVDWNSLLTVRRGDYESGAFDVRTEPPLPTVLATAACALATGRRFDHPVLDVPGWWRRAGRCYSVRGAREAEIPMTATGKARRRLLIVGADRPLGQALARMCEGRGLDYELWEEAHLVNFRGVDEARAALRCRRIWAVLDVGGRISTAGADGIRRGAGRAAAAAYDLNLACGDLSLSYLVFSSHLVFDGLLGRAYLESDLVSPGCHAGTRQTAAECRISTANPAAMVVRTSGLFGPWDRRDFAHHALHALTDGRRLRADAAAVLVSPTYLPDLANAALDLVVDGANGMWHIANAGAVSWYDFALQLAARAGLQDLPQPISRRLVRATTALGSERGVALPPLEDAVDRFVRDDEVFGPWRSHAASSTATACPVA